MDAALKKGFALLLLVFVGFYLFTDPRGSADILKQGGAALWDGLERFFEALISFLNAMFA